MPNLRRRDPQTSDSLQRRLQQTWDSLAQFGGAVTDSTSFVAVFSIVLVLLFSPLSPVILAVCGLFSFFGVLFISHRIRGARARRAAEVTQTLIDGLKQLEAELAATVQDQHKRIQGLEADLRALLEPKDPNDPNADDGRE